MLRLIGLFVAVLIIFVPAFSWAQSEPALDRQVVLERMEGNTLEYLVQDMRPFRIWIYHSDNTTAYLFSERNRLRRPLQTTWRTADDGAYCYSSRRFGERCFNVYENNYEYRLESTTSGSSLKATLYEGDAQGLVALAEGRRGSTLATHPSLVTVNLPPLIPISEFFGNRLQSWGYRVSPDGKTLGWIARTPRGPRIHVRPIEGGPVRVLQDRRHVSWFLWAVDSRRVLFFRDTAGDENFHIFVADTEQPETQPRDLTPGLVTRFSQHLRTLVDDPDHIITLLSDPQDPIRHLYRINIHSGAIDQIEKNPGEVLNWVTDTSGTVIGRYRKEEDGRHFYEVRSRPDEEWRIITQFNFDEFLGVFYPPPNRRDALAISDIGRDKRAMVRLDHVTGEQTVLFEHPNVDISRLYMDLARYEPLWVSAWNGYQDATYFDLSLEADLKLFERDGPVTVSVYSADRDWRVLIVTVESDVSGRAYYLFDRRTKSKELLAAHPMAERAADLSPSKPISFVARDGLTIHGYLIVPKGTTGKNLPMVLRVHGGPRSQDIWSYSADDQFLANRGYAVLRINYRGSRGYGKAFTRALKREAGRKMHNDLLDGIKWAVSQGIADPDKIAIYGRSFGGYATLVGMTMTPDVFAAGIDVVGLSDLVPQAAQRLEPGEETAVNYWNAYMGNAADPAEREDMAARSPINFVERISKPLLVIHGANDNRVDRSHSDRLVAAMREAGKPVEYILFDNEGHQIRNINNQRRMMARIQDFLARHLGGRSGRPLSPVPQVLHTPTDRPPQLADANSQ